MRTEVARQAASSASRLVQDMSAFLFPQAGYVAKSSGEPLWMHHAVTYRIVVSLLDLFDAEEKEGKELEALELACLLHDLGKEKEGFQSFLHGERKKPKESHREVSLEEVRDYLRRAEGLARRPEPELVEKTLALIRTHHPARDEDLFVAGRGVGLAEGDLRWERLLLRWGDNFASVSSPEDGKKTVERENRYLSGVPGLSDGLPLVSFLWCSLGREPSPSAVFLFAGKTVEELEGMGYRLLVSLPDFLIFARRGKSGEEVPSGTSLRIAEKVYEEAKRTFMRNIRPHSASESLFRGLIKEDPASYLQEHEEALKERLKNKEERAATFFKLLSEITEQVLGVKEEKKKKKEQEEKDDEAWWPLFVVQGLVTNRGTKVRTATKKWEEKKGPLPRRDDGGKNGPVDRGQALDLLFHELSLQDLLPPHLLSLVKGKTKGRGKTTVRLSSITSDELFAVLLALAEEGKKESEELEERRLREIACRISLPEKADFRKVAQERFIAWKEYKRAGRAIEGTTSCKICGSPFSSPPGAEAPRGSKQSFGYLKPNPTTQHSICYLCSYDMSFYGGRGRSSSYFWVLSKVDLGATEEIARFVQLLTTACFMRNRVLWVGEEERRMPLPLPRGFSLPLPLREEWAKPDEDIIYTDVGFFVRVPHPGDSNSSPKNARALYAFVYDLLQTMGFTVEVLEGEAGFKRGLYGEGRRPSRASLYESLSVVFLVDLLSSVRTQKGGRKEGQYLWAWEMIHNSPSVAFSLLARRGLEEEGRHTYLDRDKVKAFLVSLARYLAFSKEEGRGEARRERGKETTMSMNDYYLDLFEAAHFFSENLWRFCFPIPSSRGEGTQYFRSKHEYTKPLSRALEVMITSKAVDPVQAALSEMSKDVSERIKKEDREALQSFINGSQRYFFSMLDILEKEGIPQFLSMKNALVSLVFLFSRYGGRKNEEGEEETMSLGRAVLDEYRHCLTLREEREETPTKEQEVDDGK